MKIEHYQRWTRSTAIYPAAGTGEVAELMYLALGLAGEVGELTQLQTREHPELLKELGDVAWYVARLASALNLTLSEPQPIVSADFTVQCLGLAHLAGMICNSVKKLYRDGDNPQLRAKIQVPLLEIVAYLATLSIDSQCVLADVLAQNHDKLESRKSRDQLGGSGDHR
jgi:NTP pyrophosphatase (non-canonical NTP hydrolase)